LALVLTLLLTLGALALFALAMARHHRRLFGRPPSARLARGLRALGWTILIAAPLPWMAVHGAWIALVAWIFCGVPVVGLAVVAICSFAPPASATDSESAAPR
jgi:hypothetical protein